MVNTKTYEVALYVERPAVQTGCFHVSVNAASPEEATKTAIKFFDDGAYDEEVDVAVTDWHYEGAEVKDAEVVDEDS